MTYDAERHDLPRDADRHRDAERHRDEERHDVRRRAS